MRLRLALRNLIRQRRRTLLSGAAMVVAMALLVFSRALAEGGHEDWIDSGVRIGGGHVSVQAPEYRSQRTIEYRLSPEARAPSRKPFNRPRSRERLVATPRD